MTPSEHLEASNACFTGRTKVQEVITDTTEGIMSESEVINRRAARKPKKILPLNESMPQMSRDMRPKKPAATETLPDTPIAASAPIRRRG